MPDLREAQAALGLLTLMTRGKMTKDKKMQNIKY